MYPDIEFYENSKEHSAGIQNEIVVFAFKKAIFSSTKHKNLEKDENTWLGWRLLSPRIAQRAEKR